jgi:hypothetical protein
MTSVPEEDERGSVAERGGCRAEHAETAHIVFKNRKLSLEICDDMKSQALFVSRNYIIVFVSIPEGEEPCDRRKEKTKRAVEKT